MSKVYQTKLDRIRKRINNDSELKSTGKKITYTSLVCFAITLSGATIQKANTLLFEINFTNPQGLSLLLLFSLIFLMVKYNGLAMEHLKDIKELDESRLHMNPFIFYNDKEEDAYTGVIGQVVENSTGAVDARLKWKPLLNLYVDVYYKTPGREDTYTIETSLNDGEYQKSKIEKLKIIKCLTVHKASNYINYPDHLNLMGPYFLGCSSIVVVTVNLFWPECFSNMMAVLR